MRTYDIFKEVDELIPYVRSVTDEDRKKFLTVSHSRLEQMVNCPFAYNLKYNKGKYTTESTLALELGSLLHLVLEKKHDMLVAGEQVDYAYLDNIKLNGYTELNEKTREEILGVNALKKKYWETWAEPDSEGRTYNQKLELFDKVLHRELEEDEWKPWLAEHPFEFVFNDRVIIKGFIDSIRKNEEGEIQVSDYKTSKKCFDRSHLTTSQQFSIYCMAIVNEFNILPVECVYKMILLNCEQQAFSKGWAKRAVKKLNKILDSIDECESKNEWQPKPTPLCHWCSYSETNPTAKQYSHECPYYSLWTPNNKTFEVNEKYGDSSSDNNTKINVDNSNSQQKRKIIF